MMKKSSRVIVLLGSFLLSTLVSSNVVAVCPHAIDPQNTDFDGMPFCPDVVKEFSAASVFNCARNQAKRWNSPKKYQRQAQARLLSAFKTSVVEGVGVETTAQIMSEADKLKLQVCRVKNDRVYHGIGEQDSYLLLYTKPGVRNYSGPFFMLRETDPSNVIILSPHDGSDGTHSSTKKGLSNSHALAVIANGHRKGITHNADFVDHMNTMGSVATRQLRSLFDKPVFLMIHGMKNKSRVLRRSRSHALTRAFEEGVVKGTNIKKNAFGKFNAGYVTDRIVKTPYYLKTEIPARIHVNNPNAMAVIVRTIEENSWAWPGI